ncbi:hypothetical protein [Sphingomonas lenta]|uniref:hypothetical protein n=1 Tax=Sphingomonas lenta TaxID=1141887 RepID=UPI001140A1C8|nr:hypothetical protein [Sphingomonas lenta]
MGKPVSIYSGKSTSVKGAYSITVPQPNSEFESYGAVATASGGVCKVWGTGRDHESDNYGTSVRDAFNRLRAILDGKYGQSDEISFLRAKALWDAEREWTMSIKQGERTVVAYWTRKNGLALPDGLTAIMLQVKATSSSSAYLNLTYEFENFATCQQNIRAVESEGL